MNNELLSNYYCAGKIMSILCFQIKFKKSFFLLINTYFLEVISKNLTPSHNSTYLFSVKVRGTGMRVGMVY